VPVRFRLSLKTVSRVSPGATSTPCRTPFTSRLMDISDLRKMMLTIEL
jgi:hypothetical protein